MLASWTRRAGAIGVLALGLALAGCGEPGDVTLHSPGKYKGEDDPLLEESAEQRAERLAERFRLVQSDR